MTTRPPVKVKLAADPSRGRDKASEWEIDEAELDLRDAFAVKAASGLTMPAMLAGSGEMDPLALQALVWFCRTKYDGEAGLLLSTVDFRLMDLELSQDTPEEDDEPDPTPGTESSS